MSARIPEPGPEPVARIEVLRGQPDETELAAISAAVLALARPAPPAAPIQTLSPWLRAGRLESHERVTAPMEASVAAAAAQTLWPG
ncbi:MAG: acyl-CoA carboxylase epsilon subunit [Candidatus Sericytochromatia bacterium]